MRGPAGSAIDIPLRPRTLNSKHRFSARILVNQRTGSLLALGSEGYAWERVRIPWLKGAEGLLTEGKRS